MSLLRMKQSTLPGIITGYGIELVNVRDVAERYFGGAGAAGKDYRGNSWSGPNNDSEFFARSQDSFYKKTSGKKDWQMAAASSAYESNVMTETVSGCNLLLG